MEIRAINIVTDAGAGSRYVGEQINGCKVAVIEEGDYRVCGDPFPCFNCYDTDGNLLAQIRCVHQCEIVYAPEAALSDTERGT